MNQPIHAPAEENIKQWETFALAFLRNHLRETAPNSLGEHHIFESSPLDGDGPTAIFRFEADRTGKGPQKFVVVVGQTEPNYYPDENYSFDDAFDLHLGTCFMLVLGVAQVHEAPEKINPDEQPYDVERDARLIINRVSPDANISDIKLASLFDVGGQYHAIISCRIDGVPIYILGRDAPFGFSPRHDLAPQVVFRIHLGRVLRMEPDPDAMKE